MEGRDLLLLRPISRLTTSVNQPDRIALLNLNYLLGVFTDKRVEQQFLVDLYLSRAATEVIILGGVLVLIVGIMSWDLAATAEGEGLFYCYLWRDSLLACAQHTCTSECPISHHPINPPQAEPTSSLRGRCTTAPSYC